MPIQVNLTSTRRLGAACRVWVRRVASEGDGCVAARGCACRRWARMAL